MLIDLLLFKVGTRSTDPQWYSVSIQIGAGRSGRIRLYESYCVISLGGARAQRSGTNWKPARPSTGKLCRLVMWKLKNENIDFTTVLGDVIAAFAYTVSRANCAVRAAALDVTFVKSSELTQNRVNLLPENDRKHADGKSVMWYVQKLNFTQTFAFTLWDGATDLSWLTLGKQIPGESGRRL